MIMGQEEEHTDLDPHLPRASDIETVTYRIAVYKIFKGITVRKTKIKIIRYDHHGDMKRTKWNFQKYCY